MDGAYPSTVQKLLLYWYPPPSITSNGDAHLLDRISQLHTPVKDNELRPCHQLDYATSGVLLVARSREAAAAATEAFASRSAQKKYLAIVNGHVEVNENWPMLQKESLQILEDQETLYRQGKAKKRKDTFVGFMPVHAMFHKWQAHFQKQKDNNAQENSHSKRPRRERAIDIEQLWKQAMGDDSMTDDEQTELASSKWKEVKNNQRWTQHIEHLTNLYNDAMRPQNDESSASKIPNLPTLFRIKGEPENSFYIFAPLAQVDDDFLMRLQPNSCYKTPFDGKAGLDYKAALTCCTVLQHGTVGSSQNLVTKVQLSPKTGRRHQLRLHMVVAGHAIVGDVSYNKHSHEIAYPRMCLHAHSLSLPLLNRFHLNVTAQDAFLMSKNGELLLPDFTFMQFTGIRMESTCTQQQERASNKFIP
jgi:23S rRNA-/tRNA-specific pseudouridylate synthase